MRPASTIREQKSKLRTRMRGILALMPAALRRQKSLGIVMKIQRSAAYRKAHSVLVYIPLPREVDVRPLIKAALREGKSVYAPRLVSGGVRLEVFRIQSFEHDLKRGSYGILEPRPLRNRLGRAEDMELILAPGLAFDGRGGRLGRGLGCFDRFLKKASGALIFGVAFREQKCRRVPIESHDIKVNRVFTD